MSPSAERPCIFCAIRDGQLPASFVYRDQDWMILMDIHPIRPGHVLIIPSSHEPRLSGLPSGAQAELFQWAGRILSAQESLGLSDQGANLLLNDGKAGDQHVPHLHLHCLPRRPGDRLKASLGLVKRMFGMFGGGARRELLDAQAAALREALDSSLR